MMISSCDAVKMVVPRTGLEPVRRFRQWIPNPPRLPISPPRHKNRRRHCNACAHSLKGQIVNHIDRIDGSYVSPLLLILESVSGDAVKTVSVREHCADYGKRLLYP